MEPTTSALITRILDGILGAQAANRMAMPKMPKESCHEPDSAPRGAELR